MKPFNLEQAKQGKKVVTRDGREVTFGAYNQNALFDRQIVGWVGNNSYWWNGNGLFLAVGKEDELDLFMATEKKTVWVNVYESQLGNTAYDVSHAYDTKNLASANGRTHRKEYIGTYPIEIEV